MNRQLPAIVIQILGIAMVLFSLVFWAFTGRQSLPLLSTAAMFVTAGAIVRVTVGATKDLPPPEPPPPANKQVQNKLEEISKQISEDDQQTGGLV